MDGQFLWQQGLFFSICIFSLWGLSPPIPLSLITGLSLLCTYSPSNLYSTFPPSTYRLLYLIFSLYPLTSSLPATTNPSYFYHLSNISEYSNSTSYCPFESKEKGSVNPWIKQVHHQPTIDYSLTDTDHSQMEMPKRGSQITNFVIFKY